MSRVPRSHRRRIHGRNGWLSALALSAIYLGGCDNGPPRFGLSGNVSYDGMPVDAGNIGFVPIDAASAVAAGAEIAKGRYEIPRHEGLVAGTYRVVVYAERPSGEQLPSEEGGPPLDVLEQYIPSQYNEASTLEVEIDSDQADLNFALDKPVRRRGSR